MWRLLGILNKAILVIFGRHYICNKHIKRYARILIDTDPNSPIYRGSVAEQKERISCDCDGTNDNEFSVADRQSPIKHRDHRGAATR